MRRHTPVALIALLMSASALGVGADMDAAEAEGSIRSPGEGVRYETPANIQIRASVRSSTTESTLTLRGPGESSGRVVARVGPSLGEQSLNYDLDTSCGIGEGCPGPAANGTWSAALSGGSSASVRFVLAIAPAAPHGFVAQGVSATQMRLSWRQGRESDLRGYKLGENGQVLAELSLSEACPGGRCGWSHEIAPGAGREHTYNLVAVRALGPESPESIQSSSVSATGQLPEPPAERSPQSPDPEPTAPPASDTASDTETGTGTGTETSSPPRSSAGPGAGSGTGASPPSGEAARTPEAHSPARGSARGGSAGSAPRALGSATAAAAAEFSRKFNTFGPSLGQPKLPPLPQVRPAEEAYQSALPYEAQFEQELQQERQAGRGERKLAQADESASSPSRERLARAAAGGILLLLIAAHLRAWSSSVREP